MANRYILTILFCGTFKQIRKTMSDDIDIIMMYSLKLYYIVYYSFNLYLTIHIIPHFNLKMILFLGLRTPLYTIK